MGVGCIKNVLESFEVSTQTSRKAFLLEIACCFWRIHSKNIECQSLPRLFCSARCVFMNRCALHCSEPKALPEKLKHLYMIHRKCLETFQVSAVTSRKGFLLEISNTGKSIFLEVSVLTSKFSKTFSMHAIPIFELFRRCPGRRGLGNAAHIES